MSSTVSVNEVTFSLKNFWELEHMGIEDDKQVKWSSEEEFAVQQFNESLKFDVLKVEDLHYYNICCLVHKFIHHSDSLPLSISNIFVQHTSFHSYNTRYKHDLHATHINTKSYGSKTMSYKGRQYWNHLPPELKNQEKTKPFKSELKKRCLQKYID